MIFTLLGLVIVGTAQNDPSRKDVVSPSIGLPVGQKAPIFTSLDQLGQRQSNETLSGSRGTVILFFRSADW